jgi:hypothetical protein
MKTINNRQNAPQPAQILTLAIPSQQRSERIRRIEKLIPLIVITLVLLAQKASAQHNISEIVTDFRGYWRSGTGNINSIKPDSSHNLLSFSFLGNRYSTGVDDAKLAAHGLTFIPGDFKALPVQMLSGTVNSNTKIGLGARNDGNLNGAGATPPSININPYLTDGSKGLDIGTCVANLPAGDIFLPVSQLKLAALGDNMPDMVITQTADPSSSYDRYEFTDINGNRVGNYVDINLTAIPSVGNWMADFYEAHVNPAKLVAGYTNTERALRLWAADFSEFGINSSNFSQIAYFKIRLNGNSDVAFVAYNQNAIEMANTILPVTLTAFSGKATKDNVQLSWQTASEMNSKKFVVEMSTDGSKFIAIDSVNAAGVSHSIRNYSLVNNPATKGAIYYRLKQVDNSGNFQYSKTIVVNFNPEISKIAVYPNPAQTFTIVNHPAAKENEKLLLFNINGILVGQKNLVKNSIQTRIEFSNLPAGNYQLVLAGETGRTASKIILQ